MVTTLDILAWNKALVCSCSGVGAAYQRFTYLLFNSVWPFHDLDPAERAFVEV